MSKFIYIYIYIYLYIYIYMSTFIYIYIYACICINVYKIVLQNYWLWEIYRKECPLFSKSTS